ncbi:hypothetical protein FRB91_002573 [Serendipita sp. 411]|nr:hypothetical protein FRC19_008226 [Serendipita sp. 401]KAG8825381.1 hypothetical protein FRC18_010285 [Serendipita sp. 400]KAG8855188.1 hypothetical protein FRB91_002573 [Serendipita sp. 411]KAG9053867.1 hypothetical protein FS842_006929 [Serendipita sp. 407]
MILHENILHHVLPLSSQTRRPTSTSRSRSRQSTPPLSTSRAPSPSSKLEQTFHLTAGSSHPSPWLSLRVKSNASPSHQHPIYFDKDIVEGSVHLNLSDNPTSIVGISVIVRGQLFSVGGDHAPFLELSQTLWSSSMGHPSNAGSRQSPFTGRLSGSYSWPFSIPLPPRVVVGNQSVPLPPTFAPKASSTFIDYKIQVLVQRGPLRVNNTLTTSFVYLPRLRAPRPSPLLEAAYQNHSPILGPSLDSEGWDVLPARTVPGVIFGARKTSVDCSLSLSQPTRPVRAERRYSDSYEAALPQARIYARDCPIHLHITLESYDTQLLDLLNASSLKIQLVQQVRTQTTTDPAASSSSSSHPHTVHRLYKADASNNEIEEPVVIGSCWKSFSGAQTGLVQTSNRRHYEAELIIRKDLKPSFTFPSLSLQYNVQLLIEVTGFVPLQKQRPVFSEPVTIVTDRPRGPLPSSQVPPPYHHHPSSSASASQ